MKTKLKLCALIVFALAAALPVEAQVNPPPIILAVKFCRIRDFGGTGDFSAPVGVPAQDSQGNIFVACGTGDPSVCYYGGVAKFSGFGPVIGDWNGDGVITGQIAHKFAGGSDGAYASTSLSWGDGEIFGGTSSGGSDGVGVLYALNTSTGVNVTSSFAANTGAVTDVNINEVRVVQNNDGSASLRFVVASQQTGGSLGMGAVLKISPSGQSFVQTPVCDFNGDNGEYPIIDDLAIEMPLNGQKAAGVKAKANTATNYTLYGVTFFGGTNAADTNATHNYGTVFKVNDDGSGFQTLYVFSGRRATNGYGPAGGLVLSGSTLYGSTSGGGSGGSGTVFKMDTSGSNFMVLKSFSAWGTEIVNGYYNYTNSDGMAPEGDLILSGDTLYGTTLEGGPNGGGGVVYSINTNGGNFTLLHSFSSPNDNGSGVFTNLDGGGTRAGLLLSGHVLFGTTPRGGTYGGGTLFAIVLPSPPSLNIAPLGGNFAVSWRSSATNFVLQQNSALNLLTWSNFTGAVNDNGTNKSVSVVPAGGKTFFRLINTNAP